MVVVHLLDYGAGNVRSVRNAIVRAGFEVAEVSSPAELASASILVFPGVGCFGACVEFLDKGGFRGPLLAYIRSGRPFMGICLGMQTLFESSEETAGSGLGVIPGFVTRFPPSESYSVPHIGWNGVSVHQPAHPAVAALPAGGKVYFVHSYRAPVTPENASWVCTTTDYGGHRFISSVAKGNVFATQFHPEKSAGIGIDIFRAFLTFAAAQQPQLQGTVAPTLPEPAAGSATASSSSSSGPSYASVLDTAAHPPTRVCRRIVACLDVRTNDDGDLVVTKGDKYDVREKDDDSVGGAGGGGGAARGGVRNLGKPVELSARYYDEGADEIAFLNITAFREEPLDDLPMLAVLEGASERVFVPLTIGGGIRSYTDSKGRAYSALAVAARYFRAGADKISIGSDAVAAAEAFYARGRALDGSTAIEAIAEVYGRQAVVVSIDPRRVYVASPDDAECVARGHVVVPTRRPGPAGEGFVWFQCTVRGGREGRPLCAVKLAQAVEALGAGELLVNCVDNDGQKGGFDDELLGAICRATRVPVIASSGAGVPSHFTDIFERTRVEAALAAGIFHRKEVAIEDVKATVAAAGIETRRV